MKEANRSGTDIEETQSIGQPLSFGGMVRDLRVRSGLTQEELGQRIRSDRFRISTFETGTTLPHPTTAIKLIEALGLNPDGVEINALAKQYKVETERKKSNRLTHEEKAALDDRLSSSTAPINYSVLSRELGVSRRTISRRHRLLRRRDPRIAPNLTDGALGKALDSIIRTYRQEGMTIKEIQKKLHVGWARVQSALGSDGESPRLKETKDR